MHVLPVLVLCLCIIVQVSAEESCSGQNQEEKLKPPPKHYNIILLGATGDLAQKYLWKGFFKLFARHQKKGETAFHIYACGTSKPDDGRQKLSNILLNVLQCKKDSDCLKLKSEFVQITQYHQLKTAEHYKKLNAKINENSQTLYGLQDSGQTSENGRLVYLSIPPSAYTKATKFIHQHLRPNMGRPWFKIVLEKPFGHDKESAIKLSKHLSQRFKEEEIYRIDHYLGKPLVKDILPFRQANRHLYEHVWNHQHIEKVEVVMKETIDCKGRTNFYEEVGVVRDVMQNHLTEVMTLIAMELPEREANIQTILNKKQQLLKDILPLDVSSTVIGQYETYATEVEIESDDNNKTTDELVSNTATFGAAVLYVNNARWKDVPFVLMSGKKLDEKASYVRISFKNNRICIDKDSIACNKKGQMVFLISSNDVKMPTMITVSKTLETPRTILGWKLADWKLDFNVLGENLSDAYQLIPDSQQPDAYTTLIEAVYEGQRHLFTNTDNLISSWDIWSDLVKKLDNRAPRKYLGKGLDKKVLDFLVMGNRVEFIENSREFIKVSAEANGAGYKMRQIPNEFRGQKVVVKVLDELIEELAMNIEASAWGAVEDRGVFHLALPGGFSPRPLFTYMANNLMSFPWKYTHIWQVDERCVETNSKHSNFKLIQDYLLNFIHIPFTNVHPMPVHLLEDLCDSKYNGDLLYEAIIKRHVLNNKMDFIVLGMGQDGHTASLFPNEDSLSINDKLISYEEVKENKVVSPKRMTMTFPLLNTARNVSIIATGKGKHAVLEKISLQNNNPETLPITKIQLLNGNVTWYIDTEAFYGTHNL